MSQRAVSERVRVRRHPERAVHERAALHAVLDEALVCHVGLVDDGQPFVLPMVHARIGDTLYIHGSTGSRVLALLGSGAPVCVTATLVDGLVVSRSVFGHAVNYRSAVVLGRPRLVTDAVERTRGLRAVTEHVLRGRWDESRQPNDAELAQTALAAVALDEASVKVRTGPPIDGKADRDTPMWAGEVPLTTVAGEPIVAAEVPAGTPVPASVRAFVDARRG